MPRAGWPKLQIGLLAALPALALGPALLPGCGAKQTKNVLLIIIDTLRADRLACYGYTAIQTPNIDRLAREGVRFRTTVSQVPVTNPSVASILTGEYPQTHGVRDNGAFHLRAEANTLAERFAAAGYQTAAFVSASVLEKRYGLDQGFGVYDDDVSERYTIHLPGRKIVEDKHQGIERRAESTTERAIRWLREHEEEPFFLVVHYFDPHAPADPPPPWQGRYAKSLYDGEVAYVDENVGRLIANLELRDLLDETLIVLTADHGEGLLEHDEPTHGFFIYDTTVLVPLIFRGPGVRGSNRIAPDVVQLVDVAPTLLEMAGISRDGFGQGRSLVTAVARGKRLTPEPAFIENFHTRLSYGWSELLGVRTDRWKYIRAPRPELYDTRTDPRELMNVHDSEPTVVAELSAALDGWVEATQPSAAQASVVPRDEETRRKLRALGYLSDNPVEAAAGGDVKVLGDPAAGAEGDSAEGSGADAGAGTGADAGAGTSAPAEDDKPRLDPKDGIRSHRDRQYAKEMNAQAITLIQRGQKAEAEALFKKAVEIAPGLASANYNMGIYYDLEGQHEKARDYFLRTVDADPRYADGWKSLANMAYADGDDKRARECFEKAVEVQPGPATLTNLLFFYLRTGSIEDARRLVEEEEIREKNPKLTALGRGFAEWVAGNYEEERDYWKKYLERVGEDRTAMLRLIELKLWEAAPDAYQLMREARYEEALPLLEAAFEAKPRWATVRDAYARVLAETKTDFARAEQILRETVTPEDVRWWSYDRTLSRVLFLQGKTKEAEAAIDRAAEEMRGVFEGYLAGFEFERGLVKRGAGKEVEAVRHLSNAVRLSVGEPWEPAARKLGGVREMSRASEGPRRI